MSSSSILQEEMGQQHQTQPNNDMSTIQHPSSVLSRRMTIFMLAMISSVGPIEVLAVSSSSQQNRRRHRSRTTTQSYQMEPPSWSVYDENEDTSSIGYYDSGSVTEETFYPVGLGYLPLDEEYFDSLVEQQSTEYDEVERVLTALERVKESYFLDEEEEETSTLEYEQYEEVPRRQPRKIQKKKSKKKLKSKAERINRTGTSTEVDTPTTGSSNHQQDVQSSHMNYIDPREQQKPDPYSFQRQNLDQQNLSTGSSYFQTPSAVGPDVATAPKEASSMSSSSSSTTMPPHPLMMGTHPHPMMQQQAQPSSTGSGHGTFSPTESANSASTTRLVPRGGLSAAVGYHQEQSSQSMKNDFDQSRLPNISPTLQSSASTLAQVTDAKLTSTDVSSNSLRRQQSARQRSKQQQQMLQRQQLQQQNMQRTHGQQPQVMPTAPAVQGIVRPGAHHASATAAATSKVSDVVQKTTPSANRQSSSSTTSPWVRKFLSSRPKDVLLPVPKDFLSDGFNLAQLAPIVERIGLEAWAMSTASGDEDSVSPSDHALLMQKHQLLKQRESNEGSFASARPVATTSHPIYRQALRLILQEAGSAGGDRNKQHDGVPASVIQKAAEALYLMVHARFVTSPRGLDTVRRILSATTITPGVNRSKAKNMQQSHQAFLEPAFGRCPRIGCNGMPLLPCGELNDYSTIAQVASRKASASKRCKRYCACCQETFYFWDSKTDGCAWGPSFCHLFLLTHGAEVFPELVKQRQKLKRLQQKEEELFTSNKNHVQNLHAVMGFSIHPATIWGKQ